MNRMKYEDYYYVVLTFKKDADGVVMTDEKNAPFFDVIEEHFIENRWELGAVIKTEVPVVDSLTNKLDHVLCKYAAYSKMTKKAADSLKKELKKELSKDVTEVYERMMEAADSLVRLKIK